MSSSGIAGPRKTTAKMIKTIDRSATALALLRFSMLRYSDKGKLIAIVHTTITNWRLLKKLPLSAGSTDEMTLGIVSPTTTQNAHMPPKAKTN